MVAKNSVVRKLTEFHLIPSRIVGLTPRMICRMASISFFSGCSSSRRNSTTAGSVCNASESDFVSRLRAGMNISWILCSIIRVLQRRDVDLAHAQHGLHDALRFRRVLVLQQLAQDRRNDLPR